MLSSIEPGSISASNLSGSLDGAGCLDGAEIARGFFLTTAIFSSANPASVG